MPRCDYPPPSKLPDLPNVKRISHSVDGVKRNEANRKLIEYYKANPVLLRVNILEKSSNQPSLNYKPLAIANCEALHMIPRSNPILRAGQAVLEKPYYNIRPQWWG